MERTEGASMARAAVLTVADTIANSFMLAVETRGDRPAIREKKFGIWHPTSWRQWQQISKEIAYGLHTIGFRPGDVASIIANAVPEWVFADMGILCAGGVSSGIYPTDSASQVEYLVNDSTTRVIFAEDEEQLDKILSCRARCPSLQKIVIFDMDGLKWLRAAAPAISPSWSTRRAPRARPRAPCTPTAASLIRCATSIMLPPPP